MFTFQRSCDGGAPSLRCRPPRDGRRYKYQQGRDADQPRANVRLLELDFVREFVAREEKARHGARGRSRGPSETYGASVLE